MRMEIETVSGKTKAVSDRAVRAAYGRNKAE